MNNREQLYNILLHKLREHVKTHKCDKSKTIKDRITFLSKVITKCTIYNIIYGKYPSNDVVEDLIIIAINDMDNNDKLIEEMSIYVDFGKDVKEYDELKTEVALKKSINRPIEDGWKSA